MDILSLETGSFVVNCYIIADENSKTCAVIDPGGDGDMIIEAIESTGRAPEIILITHCHFDHLGALMELREHYPDLKTGCHAICGERIGEPRHNLSVLIAGEAIRLPAPDIVFEDGETFTAGVLEITAIHLPGHSPGHLLFHVPSEETVFVGDVVFAGSVGRSDFPGGDHDALISNIKRVLGSLPADAILYPGHGPATTAGRELAHNQFLI
ncbi:MAG: MBL fold metallo-hydrolase [Planctomycetes bacterium]|nr:MBL fold metallo-hydrolase [Planctomycetota bacterium]